MGSYIKNDEIVAGILAGSENIYRRREELNLSNGFPVPDRDTGNNLSFLMKAIVQNIRSSNSIRAVFQSVSDSSMLGARGNSGAILSQFFYGLYQKAPDEGIISLDQLTRCFQDGYDHAFRAVESPKEGTILTAIKSWVVGLGNQDGHKGTISEFFSGALQALEETVEQTKYTLIQQKKIGKPDAGALAFLYFMEGFVSGITHSEPKVYRELDMDRLEIQDEHSDIGEEEIIHRFCTEVLIQKNTERSFKDFRREFSNFGDSLVITQNDKLLRLHIHTNLPSRVVEKMATYGKVLENKADDMIHQHQLSKKHAGKIALVVDSIADLPTSMMKDYVYQLPINFMVGDVSYLDKVTTYTGLLESKEVSTSQPNMQQIEAFIEPIINKYDKVLVLTVSSKMSGIHDRLKQVIEKLNAFNKVTLMDTKVNSVAEGLIAYEAMQAIDQGLAFEKVVDQVERKIPNTKIYVSLRNLQRMVDSGRLNRRVGKMLQFFRFLPLITIDEDGKGAIEGVAFSQLKNEDLLLARIEKNKHQIERYAVVHADDPERAHRFVKKIKEILGREPLYVDQISTVVMQYSGVGSIAIGYVLKGE